MEWAKFFVVLQWKTNEQTSIVGNECSQFVGFLAAASLFFLAFLVLLILRDVGLERYFGIAILYSEEVVDVSNASVAEAEVRSKFSAEPKVDGVTFNSCFQFATGGRSTKSTYYASIGLVDDAMPSMVNFSKEGPREPKVDRKESARAKDESACVDLVVNASPMCVWMAHMV